MLRQVEQMRLADAVHLSSGHCIMWPLRLGDGLVAKVNATIYTVFVKLELLFSW